jgi:uncharacterized membrane protein
MSLRIKYILALIFWILSLIVGWQMYRMKGFHWLIFMVWVIIMTYVFFGILKEFKSRNK